MVHRFVLFFALELVMWQLKHKHKNGKSFWVNPDGREVENRILTTEELFSMRKSAERRKQVPDVVDSQSVVNVGVPHGEHLVEP